MGAQRVNIKLVVTYIWNVLGCFLFEWDSSSESPSLALRLSCCSAFDFFRLLQSTALHCVPGCFTILRHCSVHEQCKFNTDTQHVVRVDHRGSST